MANYTQKIKLLRGTNTKINAATDILKDGVPVFNTTNNTLKIGDGTKTIAATPYITVADSAISASKINNSAVTTDKINNNAVTTAKINNNAVTKEKIEDGILNDYAKGNGTIEQRFAQLQQQINNMLNGTTTFTYLKANVVDLVD